MKNIFFLLLIMGFLSCSTSDSKETEPVVESDEQISPIEGKLLTKKDSFKEFLKKFRVVSLPYIFWDNGDGSIDYKSLVKLDKNSIDTLFAKAEFFDETYCYGILSDTSKFYSLIFLYPASGHYPVLATYSKNGDFISEGRLIASGCGSDCGLVYCSMTGIVNKDLSILSVDTLNYEHECDSNSNPIPDTGELIITSINGRIKGDGVIMLGEEKISRRKTNP